MTITCDILPVLISERERSLSMDILLYIDTISLVMQERETQLQNISAQMGILDGGRPRFS